MFFVPLVGLRILEMGCQTDLVFNISSASSSDNPSTSPPATHSSLQKLELIHSFKEPKNGVEADGADKEEDGAEEEGEILY